MFFGDLSDVLQAQTALPRAERPDAIVVELSGIADAVGVAQRVESSASVRLDGVVTVVDSLEAAAKHVHAMLQPSDVVITLGAGDVNKVCTKLAERLS